MRRFCGLTKRPSQKQQVFNTIRLAATRADIPVFTNTIPMLDINLLRRDLPVVIAGLARRGVAFDADRFELLEARRKALQVETEALQSQRNVLAKQIGQLRSK